MSTPPPGCVRSKALKGVAHCREGGSFLRARGKYPNNSLQRSRFAPRSESAERHARCDLPSSTKNRGIESSSGPSPSASPRSPGSQSTPHTRSLKSHTSSPQPRRFDRIGAPDGNAAQRRGFGATPSERLGARPQPHCLRHSRLPHRPCRYNDATAGRLHHGGRGRACSKTLSRPFRPAMQGSAAPEGLKFGCGT